MFTFKRVEVRMTDGRVVAPLMSSGTMRQRKAQQRDAIAATLGLSAYDARYLIASWRVLTADEARANTAPSRLTTGAR